MTHPCTPVRPRRAASTRRERQPSDLPSRPSFILTTRRCGTLAAATGEAAARLRKAALRARQGHSSGYSPGLTCARAPVRAVHISRTVVFSLIHHSIPVLQLRQEAEAARPRAFVRSGVHPAVFGHALINPAASDPSAEMGIPKLTKSLEPFAVQRPLVQLTYYSAVIDGPALAYHAWSLAAETRRSGIPSYADVNHAAIRWLHRLETFNIQVCVADVSSNQCPLS